MEEALALARGEGEEEIAWWHKQQRWRRRAMDEKWNRNEGDKGIMESKRRQRVYL